MTAQKITGHIDLAYPTKYVKAADLKGRDVTVRIVCLESDVLVMQGGKKERKNVLTMATLQGKQLGKQLVLNKTNARLIAGQHGPLIEAWTGKEITIYPTTTKCGRDMVECVRVRGRVTKNAEDVPDDMARDPEPEAPPQFDA
ncbi:MAG: hypothetical protein IPM54_13445 [Polyangiaceae bacterium]|nr:hypothetical protein [Polyangiaceae bacterium]